MPTEGVDPNDHGTVAVKRNMIAVSSALEMALNRAERRKMILVVNSKYLGFVVGYCYYYD